MLATFINLYQEQDQKEVDNVKRAAIVIVTVAAVILIGGFVSATDTYSPSGIVPSMVLVERGSFMMGGPGFDERPVHNVTFTYDLYIGKYSVTFEEYDRFCEETGHSRPSDNGWGRGRRPVIWVSWYDAIAYCNWLSDKEGLPRAYDEEGNLLDANGNVTTDLTRVVGYRLPTEAEWEYAARGGIKSEGYQYAGSDNPNEVAWYEPNAGGMTQEVGKKLPNELGIYDMSGNVWEWCIDWYHSNFYSLSSGINPYNDYGHFRVVRGGSWFGGVEFIRVENRRYFWPTYGEFNLGFRIARTQ